MRFELLVALRFLKEGRGQTVFILLGIAIGVSVQIFLGTLIAGLQQDLIETTVGSSPHLIFRRADNSSVVDSSFDFTLPTGELFVVEGNFSRPNESLRDWREILNILDRESRLSAVSPVAQGNAFIIRGGERWPVLIKGIEPSRANSIYKLGPAMVRGNLDLESNSLIIGKSLAEETRLMPGDNINLELPGRGRQSLYVAGIFDLGAQVLNETWIFLDLGRAQRLLGLGGEISRIEAQTSEIFAADVLASSLEKKFSGVLVDNWKDQNADLLAGLQAQSSSSVIIQLFVLLAVTLGIASVLAVSVVQKSKQIGILKAMGARSASTSRIFLFQGGILGLIGSICGCAMGFALTELFLWGTSQATGQALFPLEFDLSYASVIVAIATLASLLSALLPARKSGRLNPIDVIRG